MHLQCRGAAGKHPFPRLPHILRVAARCDQRGRPHRRGVAARRGWWGQLPRTGGV